MSWALIVHGGAKEVPPGAEEANRRGCLEAVTAGRAALVRGASALEAVEVAIRILERDPTFNAGTGSARNADGEVAMDAALMDGCTLEIGAVAAIRGVAHPVSVARLLLAETATLLVADGAQRFARERGAGMADPVPAARRDPATACDTVGCVALDARGHVAAGTSTGGLDGMIAGRVGDSPVPGCGFYADDTVGAAAFSGDGESISRTVLAARVMHALEAAAPPQDAIETALSRLARVGGEAGGIVLDREGRIGWAHNSAHFPVAWASENGAIGFSMTREDGRTR